MFSEYKYKTELHAHTSPASGCSEISPENMIKYYKKGGYTTICLTNHFIYSDDKGDLFDRIVNDYYALKEIGEKEGINIIFSLELRFYKSVNDYLIYGVEPCQVSEIYDMLADGVDNFYKNYINKDKILIQAHPFRNDCTLADCNSIDGIEVFNVHPGHNSKIAFAAKACRENNKIITCGTDFHHHGHECLSAMLTKEPVDSSKKLVEILRNKEYILELSGYKIIP